MASHDTDRTIAAARQAVNDRQFDSAAALARQVLAETPRNLDALEIKAVVESETGDLAAAEQTLRSAISIAPERRWPYADLTRLLLKSGRAADAEDVARAALQADPDNPDAHAMLGSMLAARELWFEASGHFERASAIAGAHPQLLSGRGQALLRRGRLQEARTTLESAAVADPHALEPLVYLAEVEERLGQLERAGVLLDRAEPIARARGTDVDLQRAVLLGRMGRHDEALALLDGSKELSGAARLQRGRLLERAGRFAEAWAEWVAGKEQLRRRNGRAYPAQAVADEARKLAAFFTSPGAAALPRAPVRAEVPQPIFIIGFPRSGTTLTEQILASHSDIAAGGELPFGAELRDHAAALVGGEFPNGLAAVRPQAGDWPTALRDLYLARAEQYGLLSAGKRHFTDKMPTNDFRLPLLRMAFPQSPVVLVRRHPLDVLTSVTAHDMTHGFKCGYRLEDAARHFALVDWLIEQYRAAGIGPTHELRYESLIADQRSETERLMSAIGLPIEAGQLSFHERAEVSPTPSYAQVHEPLNDRSIGRWHNFAAQLEAVRPIVADAIARAGYAD